MKFFLFVFFWIQFIAIVQSDAVNSIRYVNVGGSGTYPQITRMDPGEFDGGCTTATELANKCVKQDKRVSGPLSPFDDEITVVFRGPMNLRRIAVYQPSNQDATRSSNWNQVSSFIANNANPNNLVIMNNMGGGKSGVWSICGGNSQSYASGNYQTSVATPNAETFGTFIPANKEVNIMTGNICNNTYPCSGFSRGTANHGWSGSKMFVFQYDMPTTSDAPAIWALNAQIVRSAQYGCNCRGMGGDGGCGELDLNEVLPGQDLTRGISQIYSFKGATGTGSNSWFARPTDTSKPVTMIALFDVATDTITVQHVTGYSWPSSHTPSQIDTYVKSNAMTIQFGPPNSWTTKAIPTVPVTSATQYNDVHLKFKIKAVFVNETQLAITIASIIGVSKDRVTILSVTKVSKRQESVWEVSIAIKNDENSNLTEESVSSKLSSTLPNLLKLIGEEIVGDIEVDGTATTTISNGTIPKDGQLSSNGGRLEVQFFTLMIIAMYFIL